MHRSYWMSPISSSLSITFPGPTNLLTNQKENCPDFGLLPTFFLPSLLSHFFLSPFCLFILLSCITFAFILTFPPFRRSLCLFSRGAFCYCVSSSEEPLLKGLFLSSSWLYILIFIGLLQLPRTFFFLGMPLSTFWRASFFLPPVLFFQLLSEAYSLSLFLLFWGIWWIVVCAIAVFLFSMSVFDTAVSNGISVVLLCLKILCKSPSQPHALEWHFMRQTGPFGV